MAQQTVLNDLPEADMQFVVDVAAYAVLRTDMRVSATMVVVVTMFKLHIHAPTSLLSL
jgi:hypothetical protein